MMFHGILRVILPPEIAKAPVTRAESRTLPPRAVALDLHSWLGRLKNLMVNGWVFVDGLNGWVKWMVNGWQIND